MEKVAEAETGIKPQDDSKTDKLDSSISNGDAASENNHQEDDDAQPYSSESDTDLITKEVKKSRAKRADNSQNYYSTDDGNDSGQDHDNLDRAENVVFVDSILNKVESSKTQKQNNKRLDEKTIVLKKPRKTQSKKPETIIYY